jgi:hypothetical protein
MVDATFVCESEILSLTGLYIRHLPESFSVHTVHSVHPVNVSKACKVDRTCGLPPRASSGSLGLSSVYIMAAARATAPAIPAAAAIGAAVTAGAPPVEWAEVAVCLAVAAYDNEESMPEIEACT